MEKETLDLILNVIEDKEKENFDKYITAYENMYASLEQIKDTAFTDLNSGKLSIMPVGDFLNHSNYGNTIVEFLVIYQTDRDNINFSVVAQKTTKKGKTKVSTYQQIMGSAVNKGVMQAEQVAERFAFYLKTTCPNISKIYFKRNQIMIRLTNNVVVKITVCYDFGANNGDLVCRRVNVWYNLNPVKFTENIEQKNRQTNNNYLKVVKLFKAFELELIIAKQSELLIGRNSFVENFIYNVPNEIFSEPNDIVMVQNVITYLQNKKFNTFVMADECGNMFNEKSLYSLNEAKQFSRKVKYAFDNMESLLSSEE